MSEEKEADEYLNKSCNFKVDYDKNGNPKMVKKNKIKSLKEKYKKEV